MGTYMKPVTGNYAISCSWSCHKNRNPPSGEPGTDYPADYGTPALAPEAGKVIERKTDNSGAMGRYVAIALDDGRETRCLHLSAVSVSVGTRVTRGQTIGKVGGSGYGDDHYYGTHLHQTLWPHDMWDDPTIDFAKYVGAATLEPDQRQVKSNAPANGREEPTTDSPLSGDPLPPGTVGNFDGWINGENVTQNGTTSKVWYRGISGRWFWAGGFTSQSTSGLANLNPVDPGSRTVLSTAVANRRNDPSTENPPTGTLAAGASTIMDGWINGETVSGNKVWFREKSSQDYYWSGGFTSTSISGLTDLNSPNPTPVTRTVLASASANTRGGPATTFPVVGSLAASAVVEMDGWATGEDVSGEDIWFRVKASQLWAWSGGFTSQSTSGLGEVTDPPDPPDPGYDFEAFNDVVTQVTPAAVGNFESPQKDGVLPYTGVVLHDFGTYERDTFEGTLAWFQNPAAETSSHFVVSGVNIVQMVALEDRAYHAGPDGNDLIGIEIDPVVGQPEGTPGREETITSVNALLYELDALYTLSRHRHSEFMSTSCGDDIDLDLYQPAGPPPPDDIVEVPRATLTAWRDQARSLAESIDAFLED